ncbi:MAG: hypothetical protein M3Y08_17595 [Fibrobacterota bacterium]|nr:hypothetical protein [Fibrobacterota bacterium]
MHSTSIIHGEGLRVSGASLGVGNWISIKDGDWGTREDYGTLPAISLYFTGWDWNGSLGIPLKTSFKRIGHKTRFSLGNGEISLGKRFGDLSPRVSLKYPLYDWSVEDAATNDLFIGGGTFDLAMGVGGRLPKHFLPRPLTLQFDLEGSTALSRGLAEYGSSHAVGVVQVAYSLGKSWKAGVNSLLLFDHWIWIPEYWDQEKETNFSIVPGGVVGVRMFQSTSMDLKAGWSAYEYRKLTGAKYADKPQSSYYFGLSVFQSFK